MIFTSLILKEPEKIALNVENVTFQKCGKGVRNVEKVSGTFLFLYLHARIKLWADRREQISVDTYIMF